MVLMRYFLGLYDIYEPRHRGFLKRARLLPRLAGKKPKLGLIRRNNFLQLSIVC